MYLTGFCKTALFSEEQLLQQKVKSQKHKFDYIFILHFFSEALCLTFWNTQINLKKEGLFFLLSLIIT